MKIQVRIGDPEYNDFYIDIVMDGKQMSRKNIMRRVGDILTSVGILELENPEDNYELNELEKEILDKRKGKYFTDKGTNDI